MQLTVFHFVEAFAYIEVPFQTFIPGLPNDKPIIMTKLWVDFCSYASNALKTIGQSKLRLFACSDVLHIVANCLSCLCIRVFETAFSLALRNHRCVTHQTKLQLGNPWTDYVCIPSLVNYFCDSHALIGMNLYVLHCMLCADCTTRATYGGGCDQFYYADNNIYIHTAAVSPCSTLPAAPRDLDCIAT